MQQLLAIARLTIKAGFRYRLVLVLAALLAATVVVLPTIIKHDGTARGLAQILMTYTLSLITALLGFSTLWLACGTLARDVEECQMQLVAVKPIARWQIWVGKWLGIMGLNAMLLAGSAAAVYFLLQWRAQRLPPAQLAVLTNEVLVARGSIKEPVPDVAADVERILQERLKESTLTGLDVQVLRRQIEEQVKYRYQLVPPGHMRRWTLNLGWRRDSLRDQPLFVRLRFHTPETREAVEPNVTTSYGTVIEAGPPESPQRVRDMRSFSPASFHEFAIPPNLFDEAGVLTVDIQNHNEVPFFFPLEDGLELLYREAGFAVNFWRGVTIILCWLGLLAALGLASASMLSFPVAAFVALGLLIVGMSSGTLSTVVEEGAIFGANHEGGQTKPVFPDQIIVPVFKGLLQVVNLVQGFSPIDSLSSGRSVTWAQVGQALAQICGLMGGLFAGVGILVFTRRELATAQGTQ
jgi:hypothetical protein